MHLLLLLLGQLLLLLVRGHRALVGLGLLCRLLRVLVQAAALELGVLRRRLRRARDARGRLQLLFQVRALSGLVLRLADRLRGDAKGRGQSCLICGRRGM